MLDNMERHAILLYLQPTKSELIFKNYFFSLERKSIIKNNI